MRKLLLALVCLAIPALAQITRVRTEEVPAVEATETLFYRDGSGNYEYTCIAKASNETSIFSRDTGSSTQPKSSIATVTLTNVVVASDVATANFSGAHGLAVGHRIKILGATVDTDLNGTYTIASVPGSTSLTFTTASVADATYNEAGLNISTTAPRTNSAVWSIQRNFYSGGSIDRMIWAYGSSSGFDKACGSRTAYFE